MIDDASDHRLSTDLWVQARLRQCAAAGIGVYVVRRGDPQRGLVLLKIAPWRADCRLFDQGRDQAGRPAWIPALGGEQVTPEAADAYIDRSVRRDPDLWVIEIEARDGQDNPFLGEF